MPWNTKTSKSWQNMFFFGCCLVVGSLLPIVAGVAKFVGVAVPRMSTNWTAGAMLVLGVAAIAGGIALMFFSWQERKEIKADESRTLQEAVSEPLGSGLLGGQAANNNAAIP